MGYPDIETSVQLIHAIATAGADMMELGIPFSDPLADGVVIQKASQTALEKGISVVKCIEIVRRVRALGVTLPLFAMGYANPMIAYGEARYVNDLHLAGVDGLIIPDLPPEDSAELGVLCAEKSMALVQFAAPTSTPKRLALAAQNATGFIYIVQVTGVTGARATLAEGLRDYVGRVKLAAQGTPVVVGFGISNAGQVREVGNFADGVIVASALIRSTENSPDPVHAAATFVRDLRS
jgi:tryptophan synthase alpha chain